MSPNITDQLAQDKLARVTGGLYLAYILASVLADMLGHIGLGDAQQIAQTITTNTWSFRLGLVVAFLLSTPSERFPPTDTTCIAQPLIAESCYSRAKRYQ